MRQGSFFSGGHIVSIDDPNQELKNSIQPLPLYTNSQQPYDPLPVAPPGQFHWPQQPTHFSYESPRLGFNSGHSPLQLNPSLPNEGSFVQPQQYHASYPQLQHPYESAANISQPQDYHYQMIMTPDQDGDLPLHIAVAKEHYPEVEFIIQCMQRYKISLDKFNLLRQTPLHIAVVTRNVPIMRLLLDNGISPWTCDRHGNTVVHLAIKCASKECLVNLLDYGESDEVLSIQNYDGFAPLHLAVLQHDKELIKALVCKNADIDIMDGTSGRTPLFHAIENGYEDIVELLLALGANVNLPNYGGNTPLVVATDKGNKNITSMLISRGAMISSREEY